MRKHRAATISSLGLAIILLASCASVEKVKPGAPSLSVSLADARVQALDQHHTVVSLTVLADTGTDPIAKNLSGRATLSVRGYEASLVSFRFNAAEPEAGSLLRATIEFTVDSRALDENIQGFQSEATADWTVTVACSSEDGTLRGSASITGSYPVIREPVVAIASLRILRYELINSALNIVLEVRNPNAFPVSFSEAEYRFYGDGRSWASGATRKAQVVQARSCGTVILPITLNFTDLGRSYFDRVAQLKDIAYRLQGSAWITTGIDILPSFKLGFDTSGVTRVER